MKRVKRAGKSACTQVTTGPLNFTNRNSFFNQVIIGMSKKIKIVKT